MMKLATGANASRRCVGALLALCLFTAACVEPDERRPGLRLSGELVTEPVRDWSFTHDVRQIYVETQTPYFIPHSVTIICADKDGDLFVGARNPDGKRWVRWVERDPDVRLKIKDRIYEVRLDRIQTPDGLAEVRSAYADKIGQPMDVAAGGEAPPEIWYWRVEPRES